MRKLLLTLACVAVLVVMAAPAYARPYVPFFVSCQGSACGDGNLTRDYVYELQKFDQGSNLCGFSVGLLDPNGISNILSPEGWTVAITPTSAPYAPLTDNTFTADGYVAPGLWQSVPYEITWTAPGGGIPSTAWTTYLLGFDDPHSPVNVTFDGTYGSSPGSIIHFGYNNTFSCVCGGVGVYGIGPVHTPLPEPSSLVLCCVGAIGLLAYAWHRQKRS
jgi:hypothetical protein